MKDAKKNFTDVGKKKQGRNWHVFVLGGGKNWKFWPKYLPLLMKQTCFNFARSARKSKGGKNIGLKNDEL